MYCHNCGFETENESCPKCGTSIVKSDSKIITSWRKETDLKKVAKHPDVLDQIHEFSKLSNERINSQYLLDKFDLVFGTFTGASTNLIIEIATPIYAKLGVKTGKKSELTLDIPINEVFVKLLCAISANKKLEFNEFHQAIDGLLIICKVKPDLLSYKGDLLITLKEKNHEVIAEFNLVIKGQLYDFGKSKRIIAKILTDLKSIELN